MADARGAMSFGAVGIALGILVFSGMLLVMELGRRIGAWRRAADPEGAFHGTAAVDGAVLALLGLLVSFTFSGAAGRFDARRQLVVEETNAIGTAYLRIDIVPPESQAELRELFRAYLDSRIETYRAAPDIGAARAGLARSATLQDRIWSAATLAVSRERVPPSTAMLFLPALNAMFDIRTTRSMAVELHPPVAIFALLVTLALIASLFAGYSMADSRSRRLLHAVGFAAVTSVAVYVILDLEYPRRGLLRIDAFDHALVDLRATMHS
jgi:hypothetical protein